MIEDPVEGRGADDPVEGILKRNVRKIGCDKLHSLVELRLQEFAGRSQHILRNVESDDPAFGQGLQQICGQTASAAARIEQRLVSTKLQSRQDFFPPTDLWSGQAMIFGGVPLAG